MDRSLVRGFLSILSGRVGRLLLSIAITPLLVRLLGSDGYGEYAFVISAFGVIMIFVKAGITDGMRKYLAEDRDIETWHDDVFAFYVQLATILALLGIIVISGATAIGIVERFLGPQFVPYFYILAATVLAKQFHSLARSTLMGFGQEHRSEPLVVIRELVFGVVALGLVYIGFGVEGALLGYFIATLTTAVIGLAMASRHVSLTSVLTPRTTVPRRELLSFNTYTILLIFLTTSLYEIDILMLQPIAGSTQTGYYRAALVIAEMLWFVPFALQMVLLHSTSELWAKDKRNQITQISSRITRYTLLFTTLLCLGVAALADPFLPLYFGAEFETAIVPLLLLLPGVLGFSIARPIFAIGQGKGELRILIYATGIAAVLNFVLNAALIPRYGMYGAAIATSIGYGSMFFLHVWSARKVGFNPIEDLRLGRIILTAVGTVPIVFGTSWLLGTHLVSLVVVPPAGLIAYTVLAFATGAIEREEVRDILDRTPLSSHRFVEYI